MVICDWELGEARKKDALDRARVRGEEPPPEVLAEERGLHSSIETDVKNLLEGRTFKELETMQRQIESQMRSGTAKVVEYWEAILKRLHIYKAKVHIAQPFKNRNFFIRLSCFLRVGSFMLVTVLHMQACLKEIHASLLRKHLQRLEQQPEEAEEQDLVTDKEMEVKEEEEDKVHEVEGLFFGFPPLKHFIAINFSSIPDILIGIFLCIQMLGHILLDLLLRSQSVISKRSLAPSHLNSCMAMKMKQQSILKRIRLNWYSNQFCFHFDNVLFLLLCCFLLELCPSS